MGRKTLALCICALLILSTLFCAYAETYIIVQDFKVSKNSDGSLSLAGYEGTNTRVEVPSELYGYSVASVASRAFAENTFIKSMVLPDGLTDVGNGAFSDAQALTEIKLGKNTEVLGSNAFYNCQKLKTVDLGSSVTEIQGYTFNRCGALLKIELPESVAKIGDYAFYKCTSLEYILIPASVKEISDNAFNDCNRLTIYGETGSYAQKYAQAHSIPFASASGETVTDPPAANEETRGDVDGNGKITSDDARLLQMFCAALIGRDYIEYAYSDANADGAVTIKDATSVQKYVKYGKF